MRFQVTKAHRLSREKGNTIQKINESMVERIIRGVNHCRTALLSGFTTYRRVATP